MEDYNISINMQQLTGATVSDLRFNDGTTKKCVILPVEECGLFTGEKGVYLNLFAKKLEEERYGQSHFLRVTWPKEKYSAMYPEQRNALPIVGNMRAAGVNRQAQQQKPHTAAAPVGMVKNSGIGKKGYTAEIEDIF